MPLTARAPAKIILTGEHSVVYGKPAVVLAVNRYAYAKISAAPPDHISFTLLDLKERAQSTLKTLRVLKERIIERYRLCLKGQLTLREVLYTPVELFQYALISLIDTFQMEIQKGLNIQLHSEIPIGCGMGSSAATIVSVIQVLASFFKMDVNPEWLFRLSLDVERLQHGFSSGVDAYVSLNGGCIRFQQGKAVHCPLPQIPLYVVNTGKPQTITGECVMSVAKNFASSTIWNEFEEVVCDMEKALLEKNHKLLTSCVQRNHTLLTRLGVVPEKVQSFIRDIEQSGGAAKICGAGAVQGSNAGVVLVVADTPPQKLCEQYGYSSETVSAEMQGACIL